MTGRVWTPQLEAAARRLYTDMFSVEEPYEYQVALCRRVLDGESVVVQAPTGAGKTLAAVAPFLLARETGLPFPQRLIYILPLRTLVHSISSDLRKDLRKAVRGGFLSADRVPRVTCQTGDTPGDRMFQADIIFTTIDQALSSLLTFPFALSDAMANVNAGALLSSYLVFDEVHLLDPGRAFETLWVLWHRLRDLAPMVVMTATLTTALRTALARRFGTGQSESMLVTPDDAQEMKSQRNKKRRVHVIPTPSKDSPDHSSLTPEAVASRHRPEDRTIVFCNTVERAKDLYRALTDKGRTWPGESPRVMLVHSRFLARHRSAIERRIRRAFGKGSHERNVIVIGTQVMEAGLDITSSRLHTEAAPIESLIQRIGRCARYEGEEGEVYVYGVKKAAAAPYTPDAVDKTFEKLQQLWPAEPGTSQGARDEGQLRFDWQTTLSIIDSLKSGEDEGLIRWLESNAGRTWGSICEAVDIGDPRKTSELIRAVDSVMVTILGDRDLEQAVNFESVGVPRYTFRKFISDLPTPGQFVRKVQWAQEGEEWTTVPVGSKDDYAFFYVVSPEAAGYNDKEGLSLGLQEHPEAPHFKLLPKRQRDHFESTGFETYVEHVAKAVKAGTSLLDKELGPNAYRLAESLGLTPEELRRLTLLAVTMHDVGKLNREWQREIRRVTAGAEAGGNCPPVPPARALAHSPYERGNGRGRSLPSHSGEGGWAAFPLLVKLVPSMLDPQLPVVPGVVRAILTAIARHHSARTQQVRSYVLIEGANDEISDSLNSAAEQLGLALSQYSDLPLRSRTDGPQNLSRKLTKAHEWPFWCLYALLVRMVRLADQGSFEVNLCTSSSPTSARS